MPAYPPKKDRIMDFVGSSQKILHPFTIFYKTRQKDQVVFSGVYPKGIHSFYAYEVSELHQHDHFELLFVLEGTLHNTVEQNTYTYHKGDACLLNRNTRHMECCGEESTIAFINFSPEYIRELLAQDLINDATGNTRTSDGKIHQFLLSNLYGKERFSRNYMEFTPTLQSLSSEQISATSDLIDQMQQELISQKPGCSFLIKGCLLRLLHLLEDPLKYHANFHKLDSSNEDFIYARINSYLQEKHGCITKSELSEILNYNGEYLNQITKKRTGVTIPQLSKNYRLDRAGVLLLETDMSIARITEELVLKAAHIFMRNSGKEKEFSPLNTAKKRTDTSCLLRFKILRSFLHPLLITGNPLIQC